MPNRWFAKLSDELGISVAELEKKWKKAQEIVHKQYPDVTPGTDKCYKLVTGVFKKMMKLESQEMNEILQYFIEMKMQEEDQEQPEFDGKVLNDSNILSWKNFWKLQEELSKDK